MSLAASQSPAPSGTAFTIGVVAACYNETLVDALLARVLAGLRMAGVKAKKLTVVHVPGSNELPVAAQWLAEGRGTDVVIALGVLIRGDTIHYELIAEAATQGLQQVALTTGRAVRHSSNEGHYSLQLSAPEGLSLQTGDQFRGRI